MRARSCCCAASAFSPAWSRRRSTAACRPIRKPSAIPASTAPIANGKPFLSREVLGGGSGGRYYADGNDAIHIVPDSRNQPAEFTETRFPLLVEKLALRTDSGGAGKRRGGLGYEKHYRALVDCRTIVTADRVRLGCYGVNGGKAGQPFCVTVDAEGDAARPWRPRRWRAGAGRAGRSRGDDRRRRLGRSAASASRNWCCATSIEGRVSLAAARDDYGVVFAAAAIVATIGAVDRRRSRPRRCGAGLRGRPREMSRVPMIDRGEGYEKMLRGEHRPRMR